MPRGKKECKSCGEHVGARTPTCSCGYVFPKAKAKKKAKPFFKERKEFIKRMLAGGRSENIQLDMMTVTKIFEAFDNNIKFLSRVSPPFKLKGSIKYFLTEDGKKYLSKKKREFDYIPPEEIKIIDHKKKVGEDIKTNKTKTLRQFLNNE